MDVLVCSGYFWGSGNCSRPRHSKKMFRSSLTFLNCSSIFKYINAVRDHRLLAIHLSKTKQTRLFWVIQDLVCFKVSDLKHKAKINIVSGSHPPPFISALLCSVIENSKIDGRRPRWGGELLFCCTTFFVHPSMTNSLSKYLWMSGRWCTVTKNVHMKKLVWSDKTKDG